MKVEDGELKFTRRIHELFGIKTFNNRLTQTDLNNPLLDLDLENLLTLIYYMAGQFKGGVFRNGWQLLSLSNTDLHLLLTKAFSVFVDWPERYYKFLDWRKGQKNWSKSATGLVKDFGGFYLALYLRLNSHKLNFMREQFEEYVNQYWRGGTLSYHTRLRSTADFRRKHLTKTQASIQLKCYTTRIDRLIKAGRLKAVVQQQKSRRLFLVNAISLENFKLELEESLSLTEVSKLLGVCENVVLALVHNECLELLCGPPVDASHAWRFTRSAIEGLLSKIRSRVVRVIPRRIHKLNFRATIKKIGYIGLKSDHLVQSILEGKVNPCDMGKNISSLKFVHEDISRYVEEQKRTLRGDNIPIREAALRLGFKTMDTVYFLVKKGLISITSKQGNNWSSGLITEKEIIKFQSTYILATAIAAMHGTSSGQITNLLMRDGISPVSGRRVDDGRQYIFRKADLENVDVTELVLTAKRNRCLRSTKKLSTINLTRAAKMLDVSAKTVHKIAENGVLRTYTSGDPGTEDELRFSMFAVNRLRNHNIDYTNLISISAAAKIFGQPHIRFSKDWIQSGCLEVKCRIDKQYLLLDDVQAFARLRKKTATPGEAAKILGVGTRAIICHMNAGRLKLAAGSAKKREGKLFWKRDVEKLQRII